MLLDKNFGEIAAKRGQLENLKWSLTINNHKSPWVCAKAAEGGHLEVLQWARDNQYPWDEWTCLLAVRGGHSDILKWAIENGRSDSHDLYNCRDRRSFGNLKMVEK